MPPSPETSASSRLDSEAPRAGKVLVVDDIASNLRLIKQLLIRQGYDVVTASDGREGWEAVVRESPDVVLSDIRMPAADGFELCGQIKRTPARRLIPVVLMTAAAENDDRVRALEAGATDLLNKPVDQTELRARVRALMEFKRSLDDLESAEAVLRSLALTIEARDPDTEGHCVRLAGHATAVGRALGLSREQLTTLERGGYFHDIGKIAVPDTILLKDGPLSGDELVVMQQHPVVGDRLCGDLRTLQAVRPIVRWHHERLDGSGYPDGLRGDQIPLLAQIVGIVDVYDALTSRRPYRAACSHDQACLELREQARRGWRRADLVDTFLSAGSIDGAD
jgi:putative two-component system response regulator